MTVNGKYLGLYSNVESIKKPMLKRAFGNDDGGLFEGTVVDFFPGWEQKFEKKNKRAKLKMIRALTEVLAKDAIDLDALGKLVDLDAFVKFWAMESLIGFWDGYCNNQNNYFVYRNPDNNKFYFLPWGADSAFTESMPLPPFRIRPRSVHSQAILPNKLYRIPEVQKKYKKTLFSFMDQHWKEKELLAEIDRLESLLKDHVLKKNRGFSRNIKKYRRFVESRRQEIEKEFADGAPELKSRERTPVYFGEMGTATVKFSTKWYDRTPRDQYNLGKVEIKLQMDGKEVELAEAGAFAERSKWPSPDEVKPASIVIVAKRKSDGKKLTFGTGLPAADFKPTDTPATIGGIYIEGRSFTDKRGMMRMIGGKVTLKNASAKDGDSVSGEMEFTISQMKGGESVKEK